MLDVLIKDRIIIHVSECNENEIAFIVWWSSFFLIIGVSVFEENMGCHL